MEINKKSILEKIENAFNSYYTIDIYRDDWKDGKKNTAFSHSIIQYDIKKMDLRIIFKKDYSKVMKFIIKNDELKSLVYDLEQLKFTHMIHDKNYSTIQKELSEFKLKIYNKSEQENIKINVESINIDKLYEKFANKYQDLEKENN